MCTNKRYFIISISCAFLVTFTGGGGGVFCCNKANELPYGKQRIGIFFTLQAAGELNPTGIDYNKPIETPVNRYVLLRIIKEDSLILVPVVRL
ncbi:MAG: hypothetical protein ACMUIP_08460 [bacterium]